MQIRPQELHQRVPFAVGSLNEIREYEKAYSDFGSSPERKEAGK